LDKIEGSGREDCKKERDGVKFLGENSSKKELDPDEPYHIAAISPRDLPLF
jgi:hypothetical protein